MTLQDDGVPGAGATVQELSAHAPTGWGISCGWGGERGEWAGRMGPVRWRCQRHEHSKEQKLLQNKRVKMKVCKQTVGQQACNPEWTLAAFFHTRETWREAGRAVQSPAWLPESLSCHVLWRPSFQRPIPSVFPGRFAMEGAGKRPEGRRQGEAEGLSSLLPQTGFWQWVVGPSPAGSPVRGFSSCFYPGLITVPILRVLLAQRLVAASCCGWSLHSLISREPFRLFQHLRYQFPVLSAAYLFHLFLSAVCRNFHQSMGGLS